jgi:tRNA threonylcarbamoyladenosine biosynthesis protein TsaE
LIHLPDVEATERAGALLAAALQIGDVVALSGDLGAGKTSLVRGLIGALGMAGDVPSPSYGLVIPYEAPDVRIPVWHVDLYRVENPADLEELALDDARRDTALLIEWPERMGARLWPDALQITLEIAQRGGRNLTESLPPSWEKRWPFQ